MKSKIEEICEAFERCSGDQSVDLEHVHPMNLASVVKLYLRKLPEPLMTYELYNEWIRFGVVSFDLFTCLFFIGLYIYLCISVFVYNLVSYQFLL